MRRQDSSMRVFTRAFIIIALMLFPLGLAVTSLAMALLGQSAAFSKPISHVFIVLATFIVTLNAWTSFGRPLLHFFRHNGAMEGFKHASGAPIIGTVLVTISIPLAWGECIEALCSVVLLVVDTGGCLAFLMSVARDRKFWA